MNNFFHDNYYQIIENNKKTQLINKLACCKELDSLVTPYTIDLKNLLLEHLLNKEISSLNSGNNYRKINTLIYEILETKNIEYDSKQIDTEYLFSRILDRLVSNLGICSEPIELNDILIDWIVDKLINQIVKDDRYSDYTLLLELIEKGICLNNFSNKLVKKIPVNWIGIDLDSWINVKYKTLKDISYTVHGFESSLEDDIEVDEKLSTFEFVNLKTKDSGYIMLKDEYSIKANLIRRYSIDEWIKYWDRLDNLNLQYSLIYFYQPEQIIEVTDALIRNKLNIQTKSKYLLILLLKCFFERSKSITEKLDFYNKRDNLSDNLNENEISIFEEGAKALENWNSNKVILYKSLIKQSLEVLSIVDIEQWIFSHPYLSNSGNNITDLHNSELIILQTILSEFLDQNIILPNIIDLRRFNFYSNLRDNNKCVVDPIVLITKLIAFLNSKDFHWNGELNTFNLNIFKNISEIISNEDNFIKNSKELYNKVKITNEGWLCNSQDYKKVKVEIFILCGLIMHLEDATEYIKEFDILVKIVLKQYKYSIFKEDYLTPLSLLYVIVDQVKKDLKNTFLNILFDEIDDLKDLLNVLKYAENKLDGDLKQKFESRLENELKYLENKLNNKLHIDELSKLKSIIRLYN